MKSRTVCLGFIIPCICILSLLFIGCNNKPKQSALKIGVIIGPELSRQVDIIESAARAVCRTTGQGVVFVETVNSNESEKYEQTVESIFKENETSSSIVGLVIGTSCNASIDSTIRKAVITGHPVILFNCDLPESKRDAYVGTDEIAAGRLLGKAIADFAGTSTKVIVLLTGDENILMYRQRASAIRKQMNLSANLSIIKTIVCKDIEKSADELVSFLKHTPNVYAIASTGNWIFTKAYKKVLTGYDGKIFAISNTQEAIESLKSGKVTALVVGDLYGQAYDATHLCLMRLQNQIVENPKPLKPVLVTQDNVNEFLKKWGKMKLVESEQSKQKS